MDTETDARPLTLHEILDRAHALVRRGARYWRRALLLFLVVLTAGTGWAASRPRRFRSETLVAVDLPGDPGTPGAALRSREETEAAVQALVQRALGADAQLLHMLDEERAYARRPGGAAGARALRRFHDSLAVRVEHDTLWIVFEHEDPEVARRVVQRVTGRIGDELRDDALERAEGAVASADAGLQQLRPALRAREDARTRFIIDHPGEIDALRRREASGGAVLPPPDRGAASAEVRWRSARTRALDARVAALQAELTTLQRREGGEGGEGGEGAEPETVRDLRQRLEAQRARRAQLAAQGYTAAVSTVRQADALVQDLQAQLDAELARLRSAAAGREGVRASRLRSAEGELGAARRELAASERDDAARAPRGGAAAPAAARPDLAAVESAFDRLTADAAATRAAVARLEEQRDRATAERARAERAATAIRVIDPPSRPTDPQPPGRAKREASVILVALLLGLGGAVASGQLDPRMYDPADLLRVADGTAVLPPIPDLGARAKE